MEAKISKHKLTKFSALLCVYLAGPLLFVTTDPSKLPLPLLILPFIWMFAVIFLTTRFGLRYKSSATEKQGNIIGALLASLVVLLFVFQSIHQLSVRDVLISFAIIGVAGLYLLRADFIK